MLKNWFLSPYAIFILALMLSSPALFTGYFGDDYMHHALFLESSPVKKPNDLSLFGLFSFLNGDSERTYQLMDYGLLPWWTNPDLKYAFWRPISELTHWLDHNLWPDKPWLMHGQNIAWYLLLAFLIMKLYKRVNPEPVAIIPMLALFLYTLDSSHGFTISWIANRNSLIAATFGIATLNLYIRWHDEQRHSDYIGSLIFLALALFSAEFGISTCAYLGAFAIFLDRSGPIKGLIAIIPHASLTILWWGIYKLGGFGAANADAYYLDPVSSPLQFLSVLGERLIALIGSQWGIIPAEVYGFMSPQNPDIASKSLAVGLLFVALTLALLLPILKHHAYVRFWFFGMLFSAVPVCSAAPHDRTLLFISLGGAYCSAIVIYAALRSGQDYYRKLKVTAKVVAYALAFIHLFISPLLLPTIAYSTKILGDEIDLTPSLFDGLSNLENKEIVLFDVPMGSALAIATTRVAKEMPLPQKLWVISTTKTDTFVSRLSNNQLYVYKPDGFVTGQETATRNLESMPIKKGDTISLRGLTISVKEVSPEGHPTGITLTFERSLDDPNLILLDWNPESKSYSIFLPSQLSAPYNLVSIVE